MDVHRHPAGRRRPLARAAAGTALAAAGLALAAAVAGPATGRAGLLPVRSGSMVPALPVGSLVVVTPIDAADVEVGDVLSFHPPGSDASITHRVAAVDRRGADTVVTTRGDANPAADPEPVRLDGPAWRVRAVVPHAGTAIEWLASVAVRVGVGVLLLLLVLHDALRWVWRPVPAPRRVAVRLRRRPAPVPAPARVRLRVRPR